MTSFFEHQWICPEAALFVFFFCVGFLKPFIYLFVAYKLLLAYFCCFFCFQHQGQKKRNSNRQTAEKVCFPTFTQFLMHSLLNENKPTSSFDSSYLLDDACQINPRKLNYSKILVHTYLIGMSVLSAFFSLSLLSSGCFYGMISITM